MQTLADGDGWHRYAVHVGVGIWVAGLAGLGLLYAASPTQAAAAALAVATFYYAGQFGAMPVGLAAGGHPAVVGAYVWAADAAGLLVFFPLTQIGVERLAARDGFVPRWINRLRARAYLRREFVERYGSLGLFVFTCMPFLFNSPILGAAIGRVAGLTARRILAVLLSAITVMSAVWIVAFSHGMSIARSHDADLPWFFALATVAVTLILAGILALIHRRRDRLAAAGPPASP